MQQKKTDTGWRNYEAQRRGKTGNSPGKQSSVKQKEKSFECYVI